MIEAALGEVDEWTRSWTADDALVYALGVGADELNFATENTAGLDQQALPTYAIVLAQFGGPSLRLGPIDRGRVLHAGQSLTLHRPLPAAGAVTVRREITDVYDKGSGALVLIRTRAHDGDGPLFETGYSIFVRGEGGFGGERGPAAVSPIPDREPDVEPGFRTTPDQALRYRLSGDRNRLHSDPGYAARFGFERPILHGLATFGIAARLLIGEFAGGDAHRVAAVDGRFTRPVLPGAELAVPAWRLGEGDFAFRVLVAGEAVLDHGRFRLF
ncbi:MaoC/PaaZ C-terminal domain-containing protein [Amycolatopsis anabasis]|uniref:MaoC/PaaZ C-terminal domain-containing protein n=1 Tax=Amycolatopsis anabasis TaxID=1840409 RepID=UPI00131BB9E8|nr:MaoC/PaaZ C-terminal domain-containing protein [Amycolatopsis anabasis]